jgi:hypothetical protein
MDYTRPTIVDYGDVTELTAAQNYRNKGDILVQTGQELGIQNSTGRCQTGFQDVGGICVPLPPL